MSMGNAWDRLGAALVVMVAAAFGTTDVASGQSSSLFVAEPPQRHYERAEPRAQGDPADAQADAQAGAAQAEPGQARRARAQRLSPAIASVSYSAVRVPEPRSFSRHDLITIIIRESTETDMRAELSTEKDSSFDGEITDIPRFDLRELLNLQLRPNEFEDGEPRVGIGFNNEFEGDGRYGRSESITGRITGEIIDIKPNGMLVIEARKQIVTDDEALELVLTGMCRPDDVSIDNTVLSTKLHNLHLEKQHDGELRRSTRKGWLTRAFEWIFNF